jgi:hypothetical protein
MPDGSIADEPLAFPKDCDQIFLVDDAINPRWKAQGGLTPSLIPLEGM